MQDLAVTQPVLTSHESNRTRGKQRFEVRPPGKPAAPSKPEFNSRGRSKAPVKPKFSGFCHDQLLKAYKGTQLTIHLSEVTIKGVLVDADRYTLMLKAHDGSTNLLFKHAIENIELPVRTSP